jgi:hypothetical protein
MHEILVRHPTARYRKRNALACIVFLIAGQQRVEPQLAQGANQSQTPPPNAAPQQAPKIPDDQLDSLVSPIALYPDPLLSQVLVASTYPLEIVQLQQWLEKNKNLKDKALTDAAGKEPWDPSIQAMAILPDVVKRLADDVQWTTDLGNAFLVQQADVMDAVQRMRQKAQNSGALKTTDQQKVETQTVENKQVIVVEPANPEVVYVPAYNPTVVYGAPIYPYPAIYYPPVTAGAVIAASAISFGVGLAVGAAWGGGWGWGCGWGHNDINVNVNNNFVRNSSYSRNTNFNGNRTNSNTWQHDPAHRGGAPYADRATANKFGGTTRGDSLANRQSSARQQLNRQGNNLASNRGAGGGTLANRTGGSSFGNRGGGGGSGNFGGNRSGGDRVGSRNIPRSSGTNRSAFGSGSRGYSGGSAFGNSSRGARSMGGGGFHGGGRRR